MISTGRLVGGSFRLERQLAVGGMGSVWVAHDVKLDRPVAIKFMNPDSPAPATSRARFEREAKSAAKLRSPHVVQIYSHGHDHGTLYIVMELLEGEDLEARLRREGRLSMPVVLDLVRQIAKALAAAHAADVVHRDLKPPNIFLARTGDDELLKLLDFGVAKVTSMDDDVSHTGDVFGSPFYLSPEQARGRREVDHRSDLWAVGVIIYRALTGTHPFQGSWIGEIIEQICSGVVPSVASRAPGLPPELDAFFARALARNPDDRFQSAKELATAFAEVAGYPGTTTEPPRGAPLSDAPLPDLSAPDLPTIELAPEVLGGRGGLDDTLAHGSRTLHPGRGAGARVLWASGAAAALVVGVLGLLLMSRNRGDDGAASPASTTEPGGAVPTAPAPQESAPLVAPDPTTAPPSEPDPASPSASPSAPSGPAATGTASPSVATPRGHKVRPPTAPSSPKRLPLSY